MVVEERVKGRVYIYHPSLESSEVTKNEVYLDYSSVDLVKRVIQVIADNPDLVVENDFGTPCRAISSSLELDQRRTGIGGSRDGCRREGAWAFLKIV